MCWCSSNTGLPVPNDTQQTKKTETASTEEDVIKPEKVNSGETEDKTRICVTENLKRLPAFPWCPYFCLFVKKASLKAVITSFSLSISPFIFHQHVSHPQPLWKKHKTLNFPVKSKMKDSEMSQRWILHSFLMTPFVFMQKLAACHKELQQFVLKRCFSHQPAAENPLACHMNLHLPAPSIVTSSTIEYISHAWTLHQQQICSCWPYTKRHFKQSHRHISEVGINFVNVVIKLNPNCLSVSRLGVSDMFNYNTSKQLHLCLLGGLSL